MTPKKISTKSSYPKKIFIFLKTQKNIEIQNFEPQKMGRAYVCVKISEYPPWGPDPSALNRYNGPSQVYCIKPEGRIHLYYKDFRSLL